MQGMQFFDPPPLRYFGSKWQLADWIIEQMPPHVTYVEPFCGGASVFFRKPSSTIEVLNDLNGDIVNFFEVLRSRADELVQAIDLTPFSRAEYERSFERCRNKLERARRFYVQAYQGFGGGGVDRADGWRLQRRDSRQGTPITREWSRLDGLMLGARRLKAALIESGDAPEIVKRYDTPKTLFYVDPPYVAKSRSRSHSKRYTHEMTDEQHRALAVTLHQVKGMALLSGYKSALYDELYGDWHCASKTNTTNGNSTSVEYLWSSPNAVRAIGQMSLFGGGGRRHMVGED